MLSAKCVRHINANKHQYFLIVKLYTYFLVLTVLEYSIDTPDKGLSIQQLSLSPKAFQTDKWLTAQLSLIYSHHERQNAHWENAVVEICCTRAVWKEGDNSSGHSVIVLLKMCTIQIFPSVLMMCLNSRHQIPYSIGSTNCHFQFHDSEA